MHFHTDFLRIPQFQLLSLSRWLAETGGSRWVIAVASCPIPPLQHHDVRRHFYTDSGAPQKSLTSSHPYAHKTDKTKKVYRCISTFSPWMRPAALEEVCFQFVLHQHLRKSPFKSTVVLRSPTEDSLAQESVRVMAKHSSASRHW